MYGATLGKTWLTKISPKEPLVYLQSRYADVLKFNHAKDSKEMFVTKLQ
jgi:hypothetical protein